MRVALAAWVLLFGAMPAAAQDAAAAWSCQPSQGRLVIRFYPSLSEAPPAIQQQRPLVFSELLDVDDKSIIRRTRRRTASCQLKQHRYELTLGPGVPNPNMLGRCGAAITGVVTIRRNGVVVLEDREFELMNCHERQKYISAITLGDDDRPPAITELEYDPMAMACACIPR